MTKREISDTIEKNFSMWIMGLPKVINSKEWKEGHIQGIAVDEKKGFVYYSFTTILLKTDMLGNPIGSAERLAGHLGCITLNRDDGMVYGSLELKHDSIGKGIISRTGWNPSEEDSFYLVRFNVDKITRMGMDSENDGIMTAVYLRDVVKDYSETDEISGKKHRYGCSGIDGTAYGPIFGTPADSPKKLMVAYGIYSDLERQDNDHQVILQYSPSVFDEYGQPLNQENPHHSGPERFEERYFLYTGNTTWGIQNIEYDSYSNNWFIAVYCGSKKNFVNYPMFVCDGKKAPVLSYLRGRKDEQGLLLSLGDVGTPEDKNSLRGSFFPYGSTGMVSMGDGSFYFSRPYSISKEDGNYFGSNVTLYRYNPESGELFIAE